ncbi:MAG: hypothetical protein KZQ93_21335, partial [Candidatus Thiodiazotropha sp. (ex Monitilora ramsayi)]|nr:hypothetical protein [Candidatus Thiodiazotropha sp. (ex Monitilora ramsayi)]
SLESHLENSYHEGEGTQSPNPKSQAGVDDYCPLVITRKRFGISQIQRSPHVLGVEKTNFSSFDYA